MSKTVKKLDVIHATTSPRPPQCNSQAEVVNKTIAKYLSAFVDESTLDWEPYLYPLMFSYNTSFHRSIKTSPFFITYGVNPNLPKDFQLDYKDDISSDIMGRLQLALHLAKQSIEEQMEKAKQNYDKKVHPYQFKVNQQVLLDEHYFLGKNQKLAPKYSGPHLLTKLKGECNVELLLQNGKTCIVHVNRLKPYESFENSRKKFSKLGRDNDEIERSLAENSDTSDTEDLDLEQQTTLQQPQTPPETQDIQQQGENARLTRRQAQLQGRVYNKETQQFEIPSSSETIETLRRKSKKKIVHRRIRETEDYILVEDVYYQVTPSTVIKTERKGSLPDLPSDSDFEDSEENKRKMKQGVLTQDKYEFKPPKRSIISPAKLTLPPIPTLPKEETPPPPPEQITKKVDFKPEALVFDFPNDRYKKPKGSNKPLEFARQVLKGTAEMILPPNPSQTPRTYDDRPIKSAKTYEELMAEFPTGTQPKTRTGLAPPHEMDQTFQYPEGPDETTEKETSETPTTEEPGPSGVTHSHHPQLHQGAP